jgi:hypothetical protein
MPAVGGEARAWPEIAEPKLLERLALGDSEFREFVRSLIARVPPRDYDEASFALALDYPWARPEGSFQMRDGEATPLAGLGEAERAGILAEFTSPERGRAPLLAFGSNAAPEALERKFAHFPGEGDRSVLVLTGRLHDFDVGASPQPAVYGAMPATLFPSPGTAVRAAVIWVTPAQFTQLTWSELSYHLGWLRTRFEADDEGHEGFDDLLAYVSRFGAFCVDGRPVALAAIPATDRTAVALTQEQLLDAVAALALGPEAKAETLVRTIFADMGEVVGKVAVTAWNSSAPFESDLWTRFDPAQHC